MATKFKSKDPLAFLADYAVDDLKQALTEVVADIATEHANLSAAEAHPHTLSESDLKMLGAEGIRNLTTVDLVKFRIEYLEGVQDRLWNWYGTKCEQATESGSQGGSSLG